MLIPLTVSVWRFNAGLKNIYIKKNGQNNCNLKIVYKCMKAN